VVFDKERAERYLKKLHSDRYKQGLIDEKNTPKCSCLLSTLMMAGCKCGWLNGRSV